MLSGFYAVYSIYDGGRYCQGTNAPKDVDTDVCYNYRNEQAVLRLL